MRATRAAASVALAALAVGLGPSAAARAPIVVRAGAPPASVEAGATWTLTLRLTRGGKPVVGARVFVRTSGPAAGATRRAAGVGRGFYRARLAFAVAGTWTVTASVAGRSRRIARVRVTPPVSPLPGWRATRICGGTGNPQPQYAVAVAEGSAWVGCPAQRTVMRVAADTGRVLATIPTAGYPWSIAAAGGSLWLGERGSLVSRVDPARRTTSTALRGTEIPYLWSAAGSLWVADDGARTLLRVDPATAAVRARIPTGDGPSDIASDGQALWFANHREATIDRVDLATDLVSRLTRVSGDAPERLELAFGSLWVTGRGTDLVRLDPQTGSVQAVVDVGAGAIDLFATTTAVWVAAPSQGDDLRGLPRLERLLRVNPATNAIVETVRPSRPVMANGLAWDGTRAWLADVANGRLLAAELP